MTGSTPPGDARPRSPAYVIATDEAGYGPRLGPLVVVATCWRLRGSAKPQALRGLTRPVSVGGGVLRIDDSKRVIKPGRSLDPVRGLASMLGDAAGSGPWEGFEAMIRAGGVDPERMPEWADASHPATAYPTADCPWFDGDFDFVGHRIGLLFAEQFNARLEGGRNKADVLGETCMGLVASWIRDRKCGEASVFCDRHGGRKFYGGLIQNTLPDVRFSVMREGPKESEYRTLVGGKNVDWWFTVGGDSFPPVSVSSLIAKLIREECMLRFNAFFETAAERCGLAKPRPTAGYPTDATRWIDETATLRERLDIEDHRLIRRR